MRILFYLLLVFGLTKVLAGDDKPTPPDKKDVKQTNEIPAVISADLILKPNKIPYITNGFKVPRGVTLTIEPGVEILPDDTKGDSEPVLIEGILIIGKKGGATVSIEIPKIITFSGAAVEMNQVIFTSSTITLTGGTEGTFSNCQFIHVMTKKMKAPFEMNIPKRGILTFTHCNFINHPISLPDNIQDAKEKIQFTNCAFTPRWDDKTERYTAVTIDSNIFLVGNKCDLYTYIEWKKFSNEYDKPFSTEWFVQDKTMQKSLLSILANAKGFSVKFGHPFTNFKPEPPHPKENKK